MVIIKILTEEEYSQDRKAALREREQQSDIRQWIKKNDRR